VNLTKEAIMPLRFTTKVPAMLDEDKIFPHGVSIAEGSIDPEKAPYGLIALDVQAGQKTASYARTLTEAQASFFDQFPGQTAENAGKFVRALHDHDGKVIAYQVKAREPTGAVTYFYNQHKDIASTAESKGRPDLLIDDAFIAKNADSKGYVTIEDPVGMKALKEALDTTKKTLKARVAYTNISNPETAEVMISGAPQDELDKDHKPTTTTPLLTHALRHTAAYKDHQARGGTEAALQAMEKGILNGTSTNAPKFAVAGSIDYGYHKVTQNFKLVS
jgi:hypothetical protein